MQSYKKTTPAYSFTWENAAAVASIISFHIFHELVKCLVVVHHHVDDEYEEHALCLLVVSKFATKREHFIVVARIAPLQ